MILCNDDDDDDDDDEKDSNNEYKISITDQIVQGVVLPSPDAVDQEIVMVFKVFNQWQHR